MSGRYVQVGVTAMRAPDGSFLPAVPLYVRAEDAATEACPKAIISPFAQYVAARMEADRKAKAGKKGAKGPRKSMDEIEDGMKQYLTELARQGLKP